MRVHSGIRRKRPADPVKRWEHAVYKKYNTSQAHRRVLDVPREGIGMGGGELGVSERGETGPGSGSRPSSRR